MTNERALLDAAAANLRATAALVRAQGMASVNNYVSMCGTNALRDVPFNWASFKEQADLLLQEAKVLEDTPT